MNRKSFLLMKIALRSRGSFRGLGKIFSRWIKRENKIHAKDFLALILKISLLESSFFVKERVFLFFSFFLICNTPGISLKPNNFLLVAFFFLAKNLENLGKDWSRLILAFFSIIINNFPTGSSVDPSVLRFLIYFLARKDFLKINKRSENYLGFFLRFHRNDFEKDTILRLFLKFGLKKSETVQFLRKAKVNRFFFGSIIQNLRPFNSMFPKEWQNIIRVLTFNHISHKQILKVKLFNRKRNKIQTFWRKFQSLISSEQNNFKVYLGSKTGKENGNKDLIILPFLKKSRIPKIFRKNPSYVCVFFSMNQKSFYRGPSILTLSKNTERTEKEIIPGKITKNPVFCFIETIINKVQKNDKDLFIAQKKKFKRFLFFLKNFIMESFYCSFLQKKKNMENFSNWSFKYPITSTWILLRLKNLMEIFLIKETSVSIFEDFFSKFIKNSKNIPDQCIVFQFFYQNSALFIKPLLQTKKLLKLFVLNQPANYPKKRQGELFFSKFFFFTRNFPPLIYFTEKYFGPNSWNLEEKSEKSFYGLIFPELFLKKIVKKLDPRKEKGNIERIFSISKIFTKKVSLFFSGLKRKHQFLSQSLLFFLFQIINGKSASKSNQNFLKWNETRLNLTGKNKNHKDEIFGCIFIFQLRLWLGLITSFWANFFWSQTFLTFFNPLRKIVFCSFFFFSKKKEKNFEKLFRNWLISLVLGSKTSPFYLKKKKLFLTPNFKGVFFLKKFL